MNEKGFARAHFRSDINGLRAWAVVAVVLYHFGIPGFDGGFVGVDVFFVISGFLMTGIVVSGLEKEDFSIASFYLARGRRIMPALLVLCAVMLGLGWWLLLPADYKVLSEQAASSVTFLSNVKFCLESGYFDASSHEKWLLHTWSLAVEWQFYLLLPVVLSILWKFRPSRRAVFWAIGVGSVASFANSVLLTSSNPTVSYFMLPSRAWEMLAGGLVYLMANRLKLNARYRQPLEFIGLSTIVVCVGAFDSSMGWPGWRAALPVLGSMLVLLAARIGSPLTGNPVAQWLGTRSYSIYLWHWPITVGLRYVYGFEQPVWIAVGLALTCLLGDVSYRVVERNTGAYLSKMTLLRGFVVLLVCVTAVSAASALVIFNNGFVGRLQAKVEMVSREQFNTNSRRSKCHISDGIASPSCRYGGRKLGVVLMGDSHANAVVTALADAVEKPYGVMEWSFSACPIVLGANRANTNLKNTCGDFVNWALQKLKNIPRDVPVVIVNRYAQYAFGQNEHIDQKNIPWISFSHPYAKTEPAFLKEYAQHITDVSCNLAKSRTVYLVRPIPEMGINVPNTARAMAFGFNKELTLSLADYHARNDFIWAAQDAAHAQCGVQILDPLPYLCWDGVCHGSRDGRPLYSDDNHLSEFGNKLLVPMFKQVVPPEPLHAKRPTGSAKVPAQLPSNS
jgi:peptidoglycan/LPS O-acetylase OafA/YrhL